MRDLKAWLEKLIGDAEECELIASLTTDAKKRTTFRRMAHEFRVMAEELKADISA